MGSVVGVDPHRQSVTVAVLDRRGALLDVASFPSCGSGFAAMLARVARFGPVRVWGVEGATGLGRSVAVFCEEHGQDVREVPAMKIQHGRRREGRGKSDRLDAEAVARYTLAHPGLARPFKRSDAGGPDPVWEMLQLLGAQRRSLAKTRRRLCNEADALLLGLPEDLRAQVGVRGSVRPRLRRLRMLGPAVTQGRDRATLLRLELLAEHDHAIADADAKERDLTRRVNGLLEEAGSTLSQVCGIAARSAADLLVEVGDPHRFRSAAAFARFSGTAPLPASSAEGDGPPARHRLNRGGNRRVNAILYRAAITQIRVDSPGRQVYERARARGHRKPEARRVVQRRLSDVIWRHMIHDWDRTHGTAAAA